MAGQQQGPHGQSGPHSQFVIAVTSFLETQVRIRLDGGERDLERGKVPVEFGEFRLASGHSGALRRDERREVPRHQVALTVEALLREIAGGHDIEAETAQADDQPQPAEVVIAVLAIAVVASRSRGQDPAALVEADRSRRDPGQAGDF